MKAKLLIVLVTLSTLLGCAALATAVRSVDDVAKDLCKKHFLAAPPEGAPKDGVALIEAAETYCKIRENLEPWLGEVKRLEADGVAPVAAAPSCEPAPAASSAAPAGSATP